ncbi:S9 family peptidase [Halocalculus aciditolerans]|uniref:Peptidase n=1 Tax=Halocalculus aciditolerans TaxID=1383812 RepID=A0A830F1R7_9EURY|nr:S9 family peptidase [Halocalculus aciditolerans]GGL53313.1 peptidase [Halocalculus aciditolerans]
MTERQPYGEWDSPLSPEFVSTGGVSFGGVAVDGDATDWLERRPSEDGRGVVVRDRDGERIDVTPDDHDIRTLVHEYGGGDFAVHDDTVYFVRFDDQRVYRTSADGSDDADPLTPEPPSEKADRYADFEVSPDGDRLYAVRERHRNGDVENDLVVIPTDGGDPVQVASGHDFYAFPRLDSEGDRLCWTTWDHPRMPWDGTTLRVADVEDDGTLTDERAVLGGPEESVFQPAWSPDGTLHAVSDRSGWWNIYAVPDDSDLAVGSDGGVDADPSCVFAAEREFGLPQWGIGMATYGFLDAERIVAISGKRSEYTIGVLEDGDYDALDVRYDAFPHGNLAVDDGRVAFVGASPVRPPQVVAWESGERRVLRRSLDLPFDDAFLSRPEHVEVPTTDDEKAHALFYPPKNRHTQGPRGEDPPVVVRSHGGPTSETLPVCDVAGGSGIPPVQFLTTRGIAVLDVNYRGSTGYGRAYREKLNGEWGVTDTADCVKAAEHLAEKGRVDSDRLAIEGGSAGGYATLCALAFHDTFDAGVSFYGVADLEALARDTHKFESRYLDGLVGALPDAEETYRERSPVHHADGIACPLLLLQGSDDTVVPPSQAEAMCDALDADGVPHAYVEFDGERHGFHEEESVRRAAELDLAFYGRVFDFTPADDVPKIDLD